MAGTTTTPEIMEAELRALVRGWSAAAKNLRALGAHGEADTLDKSALAIKHVLRDPGGEAMGGISAFGGWWGDTWGGPPIHMPAALRVQEEAIFGKGPHLRVVGENPMLDALMESFVVVGPGGGEGGEG